MKKHGKGDKESDKKHTGVKGLLREWTKKKKKKMKKKMKKKRGFWVFGVTFGKITSARAEMTQDTRASC